MRKLNTCLLLMAFVPVLVFAGQKNGFVIKGAIAGLDTGTVELVYRNQNGGDTTLRGAIILGKFTFNGQVPEPELARFAIKTGWVYSTSFFLENTEMTIHLIKGEYGKTEISGSSSNIIFRKLEPQQRDFFEHARQNGAALAQAKSSHNKELEKSADSTWAMQQQQWVNTIRPVIAGDRKSYPGLYFTRWLLFRPLNYDTIMSLFMSLDAVVRNGFAGKEFIAAFQESHKISIGEPAPEVFGSDTSGKPLTLADLKGRIVLLDFWASYCVRCRQENPHFKTVYDKYHSSGFEMFSFSLDHERSAWIKAIQSDKMTWPQASDLRGGAGASAAIYGVNDLPRNFLIDRTGHIIAKDLNNVELSEKLEEILKGGH